jgi:DNA-binding CsgD family transcriptional regulator
VSEHGTGTAAAPGGEALFERTRERAALHELIQTAARGEARLALVEGPAGIGKSRLLAGLRTEADAAGFRVLSARGADLERTFPFGVVRQLFEPLLTSAAARERWLVEAAASATPVFEAHHVDESAPDVSFAALHGLYWLTLNIASDGPLALVIDDVHWSDVPSLRFLTYLVRRLEGQPILIAAGLRTAEPGTDAVLLGEIAGDPLTVPVRPGPLSIKAVGELILTRLGEVPAPEFAFACHEATGGNPLLLHELVKTFAAEGVPPVVGQAGLVRELGSRAISRTVLVRLARLSADAIAAARALAVLGDGADVGAVAALARLDEQRVADATRELTRAEILKPDPPLGFVHPLVRDAVYHDLAPGERELQHARAAEALQAAGAPLDLVAAHWLLLPRRGDPAVAEALHGAARMAACQGAPESAAAYFRRALEEPLTEEQRIPLLFELGMTEMDINLQLATGHIREAHAALHDPGQRAAAGEALARQVFFTGSGEEAAAILRQALAELPNGMDDQRQRLEAMGLIAVNFGAAEHDLAARLTRLRSGLDGDGGPGQKMLQATIGLTAALMGQPASECVPLAYEALEGGSLVRTDPGIGSIAAIAVLVLGERPEPLDFWEDVRAEAYRRGSLFAFAGIHLWRGWTLLQLGEIAETEESLRQAVEVEASWALHTGQGVIYTSAFLARALIECGDVEGARRALGRRGTSLPGTDGALFGALAEAEILHAEQRFAEAIDLLDAQAEFLPRVDNPAWLPWRSLKARALAGLGHDQEAIGVIEEDLERARTFGAPTPIGRALRLLGELQRDESLLREAAEILAGSRCRLEHAKALAALGRAVRLQRRPSEAREPLAQALQIAESCGATALVQHVRAELHASGARPRSAARSGAGSLTPSELRVAKLATEGKTNRDIAQALYVTPKTVEVHLTSAYRKLGIRSRSGLTAALVTA